MTRTTARNYDGSVFEIEYYFGEDYTKTNKATIVAPNFIEATKMGLDIVDGAEVNIVLIREISTNVFIRRVGRSSLEIS